LWGKGIVLSESGYNYGLADLHAADNGSVIVSWTRDHGFGSDRYLYANKLSAKGHLLWGKGHVKVLDSGSLQFGAYPYFVPDGKGGAVFAWYTSGPALQCFAQHILANGHEAFPHNGSAASTNTTNVRVSPAASYRPLRTRCFCSGQKRIPIKCSTESMGRSLMARARARGVIPACKLWLWEPISRFLCRMCRSELERWCTGWIRLASDLRLSRRLV